MNVSAAAGRRHAVPPLHRRRPEPGWISGSALPSTPSHLYKLIARHVRTLKPALCENPPVPAPTHPCTPLPALIGACNHAGRSAGAAGSGPAGGHCRLPVPPPLLGPRAAAVSSCSPLRAAAPRSPHTCSESWKASSSSGRRSSSPRARRQFGGGSGRQAAQARLGSTADAP